MSEDIRPYDPDHVARLEALAELVNEWAIAREAKRADVAAHNEGIKQIEEQIEQARRRLAEDRDQLRLPLDPPQALMGAARALVSAGVERIETVRHGVHETIYQAGEDDGTGDTLPDLSDHIRDRARCTIDLEAEDRLSGGGGEPCE